ncbi:glycoside hydrolase, partial [Testicularia cyperi]
HHLGIAWGCNPDCMKGAKSTKLEYIHWYQHWQDTRVDSLDKMGLQYVPSFWGPSKWDKWNAVKAEMDQKGLPEYLLAFNEPDVTGQADLGPKAAAKLWMQELAPYANKGVKVGAPQLCWNLQWLEKFMKQCNKLGCKISFIPLHWYGSWQDFDKFTTYIQTVHDEYQLPIWITEYGITQASGGSQDDISNFHKKAVAWMRNTGFVDRSAWLGGFPVNEKPDPYPNALNSYFNADGSARSLLWWAATQSGSSGNLSRRGLNDTLELELEHEHDGEEDEDDEVKTENYYDENHCDYRCQLREQSIEKHHRKKKGIVKVDDKKVCIDAPSKMSKTERQDLTKCLKEAGL